MKTHPLPRPILRIAALAAVFTTPAAYGQPEDTPAVLETEKTMETADVEVATGRVFNVEPSALFVTPANVSIPLSFAFTEKPPFVDEVEKPVPWDQLRAGLPVTVHYQTKGEKLIATKVIVTRKMLTGGDSTEQAGRKREMLAELKRQKDLEAAERTKAFPASGGGTIMGFEQVIVVRAPESNDVVQYVVNNSTLYVDTAGKPVPLQVVRTGVPVTIQFVEDAGRKIATQFVIQQLPRGARNGTGGDGAVIGGYVGRPPTGRNTNSNQSVVIDSNGAVLSDNLEDGFVSPPATVLPGAVTPPIQTPPGTAVPPNPPATGPNTTQPGTSQPGAVQPGTTQPGTTQPGATQPGTTQPGTRQPGTRPPGNTQPGTAQPGVSPGRGTGSSQGGTPAGATPGSGASSSPAGGAAAPGRR